MSVPPSSAAAMQPAVQFVSKPMVPPFRDGSKCLVRDLCLHLQDVSPQVLGSGAPAPELGEHTLSHDVYSTVGSFSPGLRQNLQAAWWMLARSRADLWHFVFAPNNRSSQVGAWLKRLRRLPTVQTIASPPKSFENPERLLFGDIVVAQSRWTKERFEEAYRGAGSSRQIVEIPPPAPQLEPVSEERMREARVSLGVDAKEQLFLYPGDLEVSQGAERTISWGQELRGRVPDAKVVIAYRDKTSLVDEYAARLSQGTDPSSVVFAKNVPDIHALVATSRALLFPVDDLYGKVDLPIVLLEAFRLGTPVVALDHGTLASLRGATLLGDSASSWLDCASRLALDTEYFEASREAGFQAIRRHYEPGLIAAKYRDVYRELLGR